MVHDFAYDFNKLLEESVKVHGHLCAGQVLGVRMSLLGLTLVGISDPKGNDRKSLIVYVEIDRCATDAIQSVTGCTLGHRSLKFLDYGKMAATFLNLATGRAARVVAREDSREAAKRYYANNPDLIPVPLSGPMPLNQTSPASPPPTTMEIQISAYRVMSDEELFYWDFVKVSPRPEDLPGKPLRRVVCSRCGEYVQDGREVLRQAEDNPVGNVVLCRHCDRGGYYVPIDKLGFEEG
ncbi:MAG: formylmethanofuran dehydrogenase [Nitrospirae bacterium]|nr:formylmethanofuran dehydrogenase [Nitrospirota bacterium]